jgi:hypothetical protein
MASLPPSPFLNSALEAETPADTDAAPRLTDPVVAASGQFESPSNKRRQTEAPAVLPNEAAGATDCISEIFHHARKLIAEDGPPRFVLDERAFMEAIEPPPLFLQAAQ